MRDLPRSEPDVEARLTSFIAGSRAPVAAVVVDQNGMTGAWLGADLHDDYEIGSVSKAITGLLYHDAVERGEVSPDTTLGKLLLPPGSSLGGVRLGDLATHRAGLPRLPRSAHPILKTMNLFVHGTSPYGETMQERLEQVDSIRPARPRPRYSNVGFELLGHAVAAAAGVTYSELVASRLARPLDLNGMYVPVEGDDLRARALAGSDRRGRRREPWTGEALGPAGGIRASIVDMGRLVSALLDGSVPGVAALEPVASFGRNVRIGAGWVTIEVGGSPIAWHNGGTGGFRSWVGVDRRRGRGAAVLTATTRSVDRFGFDLLAAR